MSRIILASASPRRRELMELAGYDFEVICADIVEAVPENVQPQEVVMSLALQKAQAVAKDHCKSAVVGSDTVVALDGKILGKPKNDENAREMLKFLSGKAHSVFTGVTLIKGDITRSFSVETKVKFFDLTDEEIDEYIKTGEPADKAGAYGIQDHFEIVKEYKGSLNNVIGLPIEDIKPKLDRLLIINPTK